MASHGLSLAQQNLEGADLSNHSWGGINSAYANLRGADFTGAILSGSNLRHADLTGADLTGADLAGADLAGADLTGAITDGATFRDLSDLNWIERELVVTGELPPIRNEFFPPRVEQRIVANTRKGDRVAQGQKINAVSDEDWCSLSATGRLMLKDYAVWLGNDISDWLDEQHKIRWAMDRCPPADSY